MFRRAFPTQKKLFSLLSRWLLVLFFLRELFTWVSLPKYLFKIFKQWFVVLRLCGALENHIQLWLFKSRLYIKDMFLRMNCDNFWMLSDASLVNFLLLFSVISGNKTSDSVPLCEQACIQLLVWSWRRAHCVKVKYLCMLCWDHLQHFFNFWSTCKRITVQLLYQKVALSDQQLQDWGKKAKMPKLLRKRIGTCKYS